MPGYQNDFISSINIELPELTREQKRLRAPLLDSDKEFELRYTHFSVVVNKKRKFAFFAATNIDGKKWDAAIKTRVEFQKDTQMLDTYQTGDELYDFQKSKTDNDFDKGHISKFQDPQWGTSAAIKKAADDTMKYTNCVPQHHTLNRGAWKSLEDYIIKKFTVKTGADGMKVSVFAGPVLADSDPYYIDKIEGKPLQIPCHFWKVVVYTNLDNKVSAVAFIMSQEKILRKYNFIVDKPSQTRELKFAKAPESVDFFADFKKGEPYQVRVDFVEQVTGLKFGLDDVFQPYTKQQSKELVYKRVEVPIKREKLVTLSLSASPVDFTFAGITL